MTAGRLELTFPDRVDRVWAGLHEIVPDGEETEAAWARFFQVTPEQVRAWWTAEGRHRCHAMSTRGHGCRNYASSLIDYDPRVWVSRAPAACPAHMTSRQEPPQARADLCRSRAGDSRP